MMSKHTPGPWKVRRLEPDGLIITRSGTYQIWTPEYDVAADVPGGGPFRKLEDAVLAAAAPELMGALAIVVTTWDELALGGWSSPPLPVDFKRHLDILGQRIEKARAAVARARGERSE